MSFSKKLLKIINNKFSQESEVTKPNITKEGSKTPLHNFPLYNIRLNPLSGRISVIQKGLSKMSISFWNAFDFQFLAKSFFHRSANQKRKLGEIKNHTRRIYYTTKFYV